MSSRRDFLKQGSAVAGAIALGGPLQKAAAAVPEVAQRGGAMDTAIKDLLLESLNAAKMGGATFADARIGRYLQNFVVTREQQIINVVDTDSIGIGVRALVNGTWGFAASRDLTRDGVAAAAREAVAIAKANGIAKDRSVQLAPAPSVGEVSWKSAYQVDPWTIPVEEKAELLIKANAEGMKAANVKYVFSGLFLRKMERNYANTDGSIIAQTIVQSAVQQQFTAVSPDFSDFQNRGNTLPPTARGWEWILQQDLINNSRKWGEEASEKLKARPVEVGRYNLVLHPSHLWLTIHESIAHPTELDRAMGYEANYAGTSFAAPPDQFLGKFKYGPEFMNIQGDRSQPGALATIGYDDEGVAPDEFLIVKSGLLNDYQTTREQAVWLDWWYKQQSRPMRSHGCSYADSWSSVQFQRMPNVSLLPGTDDRSYDDLIAATDNGIAIIGDGSFSIDQQRYNAQFGGQLFYEIKDGKVGDMLEDVAYQIRTPEFWNSMDMIGGRRGYEVWGSFFDGKTQPGQVSAVSHGSATTRFNGINIINTARSI